MTSILSSSRASIGTHSQNKNSAPDDLHVLTSHNPFPDNEDDQSSYALVTSLFSRVRNSLGGVGAPLVGAQSNAAGPVVASPPSAPPSLPVASPPPATPVVQSPQPSQTEFRRPPHVSYASHVSTRSDRPNALHFLVSTKPAQPLLSRTPVVSEAPSLNANADGDRPSSRAGSLYEHQEGTPYGSAIPGFPIPDDARSIRTTKSIRRSDSVSKVIRRIRGEGLDSLYVSNAWLLKRMTRHLQGVLDGRRQLQGML
jgi:1-phosphatidylinositol-3-phosphate 5-kinase